MSIILGVCDIGHKISFDEALRLIQRYWELGGRVFDTAHTYAHWVPGKLGASERTLGAALRALGLPRHEVKITTKGGHPSTGVLYPRPQRYLDPELVQNDLRESLDRLEMEQVDTFLLHRDDASVPVEAIGELLAELSSSGKVRRVGVSNWSLNRVMQLRDLLEGVIEWQNQGSLAIPNWEEGPDPTMRRFNPGDFAWAAGKDVICTCYSSTGNGFFSTNGRSPLFDNPLSRKRLTVARSMAKKKGASVNQIALAWLMAQATVVHPVIGTTKISHLEDAMGARSVTLSPEERDELVQTLRD